MADLLRADKMRLKELHDRVQFLGTEERGFTDSGFWLFADHVYTKDSHQKKKPIQKMPIGDKDFLKILFLYMLCCPKLAVPKSRQMMVSWAMSAFDVWHAMTAPHRWVVYQTKKEADAHAMVTEGRKNPAGGRMDFIIQHLPAWLKDENITSGTGNLVGNLLFSPSDTDPNGVDIPWYGSRIEAVPGGPDQVRGKTPSKISIDEAAFHDEFTKVLVACNPAVAGGGILHAISSVDAGSDFNALVLDTTDGGPPEHETHPVVQKAMDILGMRWPRGMKSWQTKAGVWCLELHYTADPEKDPDRQGAAWIKEAVKGYPGGFKSSGWKTEMEIDYEAGGGQKVFPFLSQPLSPVFIPSIEPADAMARMNVFAGYDYGTNNPSAFVVWGMDIKGHLYQLWELYEPCLDYVQHCNKIKRCPYFSKLDYIMADNKIFNKTQQTSDGLKSVGSLFHNQGVPLRPARQGKDLPVALEFLGSYWSDPENPTAFITLNCTHSINEVRGLKFQEHSSGAVAAKKNNVEKLVDKNNHTWDASAYAIDASPSAWKPQESEMPRDSIAAFIQRADETKAVRGRKRKGGIYAY